MVLKIKFYLATRDYGPLFNYFPKCINIKTLEDTDIVIQHFDKFINIK